MEKISRRFKHLIESPMYMLGKLCCKYLPKERVPDSLYLRVLFRNRFGYPLNLNNPKTFNEKLQWLKLHDRNPRYTVMVDKLAAKSYVSDLIGSQYVVPLLGVWDKVEDIDWEKLPDSFVLKTTHDSGGVVICRGKADFDRLGAIEKLRKHLDTDFYSLYREWPYKNVSRKIIAEEFLGNKECLDLTDFKFFCFNGAPTFCQVIRNRSVEETIDVYDIDWNLCPFVGLNPSANSGQGRVDKPINLNQMLAVCRTISKNIPFCRIDFYNTNANFYFGEITFFPMAGFGTFRPEAWDKRVGDLLSLPGLINRIKRSWK